MVAEVVHPRHIHTRSSVFSFISQNFHRSGNDKNFKKCSLENMSPSYIKIAKQTIISDRSDYNCLRNIRIDPIFFKFYQPLLF